MRRAQGLRGMKDFEFALKDLDEAMKLCPAEKDPQRLRDLYLEDQELDKRINDIMSNADSLKGKEFIDFIIGYLQGEGQ
jgi:DNA-binding transcriptional MerR regulator